MSGLRQSSDMRDANHVVTPVAQMPSIVHHGQAVDSDANTAHSASPNGYLEGHEIPTHTIRLSQQDSSDLTVPERSKSMLSMISSMVSEGGMPISPASSNAGRSTPSTIRRMHHDASGMNHLASDRIPEESATTNANRTPTGIDDDYDLYADHDGLVKDLRDERGQPLRVTQNRNDISRDHSQPATSDDAVAGGLEDARREDRPRYSAERPMSFISGHTDQDGRPQDQVNQPLKPSNAASLGAEQAAAQHQPSDPASNGTPAHVQHSQVEGFAPPEPSIQGRMGISDPPFSAQPAGIPPGSGYEQGLNQRTLQLQEQYRQQTSRSQDKSASLPKLSAVFKGIGGKRQENNQQNANMPNAGPHFDQQPMLSGHNRNASVNSGVSSMHLEQPRPGQQSVTSASPNRPVSNGAESHFSHGSQGSTYVQPTHSRVDLRRPANPMPFQGIPPQILPHGPAKQNGQPLPYGAKTNGIPETGKKKIFSALGNIFSRSNQPRLSKEQKKAQKAQRQSFLPQIQDLPSLRPLQHPQFRLQQNGMPHTPGQFPPGHLPPQQNHPMGPQIAPLHMMSPASLQGAQGLDPYGPSQHYQQPQPGVPSQQAVQVGPSDQTSAYMRTKQLAEQHQAQKAHAALGQFPGSSSQPASHASVTSTDPHTMQSREISYGSPLGGYYKPHSGPVVPDYCSTETARHAAEQPRQLSSPSQGAHIAPLGDQGQRIQYQETSVREEEAYRALQTERLRLEQLRLQLEAEKRGYSDPRAEQPQQEQPGPRSDAHSAPMDGTQQLPREQISNLPNQAQQYPQPRWQTDSMGGNVHASHDEFRRRQEREQVDEQLRLQQSGNRIQPGFNSHTVSGALPSISDEGQTSISQPHVSSSAEPQYETPQIPAAYSHVSGAFISPLDREQRPLVEPMQSARPEQHADPYSDPRMPNISPQVSAQSQMPPNNRTHSDASTVSVVSPIGGPAHSVPLMPSPPDQRAQRPGMGSIPESQQGTSERPWHLNFPEGATEQEIVRARQKQFMQQQFIAREQQHAERAKRSPSPRPPPHSSSFAQESVQGSVSQHQGGVFKELLPRSSQPYLQSQPIHSTHVLQQPRPTGNSQATLPSLLSPEQTHQSATHPVSVTPQSANERGPENPLANSLHHSPVPPPNPPHSPAYSMVPANQPSPSPRQQHVGIVQEQDEPSPPQEEQYSQPPPQESSYDRTSLDEPPPSYDGPGVPNDGMEKARPEHARPPNITTDVDVHPPRRPDEFRSRQASIGLLQHPQPASMAASPQRSSADMGAESLRRQLLQQEEHARMERLQRAQMQRAESEREKRQRDAARARARELERSVSGGVTVGSIRSIGGSRNGGQAGWERRRGSTSRPVFELAAVEDDEPIMRATSYPGQEWVPQYFADE